MATRPTHFGRYEVIGVAGKGAMGTVYIGRDPDGERKVAIKTCSETGDPDSAQTKVFHKLFLNEAHAAGNLTHPNIIDIYDSGEQGGTLYIIMEYVEGGETLEAYIKPDNLLPIKKAVETFYQCAKALDYAHRQGVIHRDIKPSNIMFGVNGAVKLCDFGVAHSAVGDMTQIMGAVGTPRYMSPEQTRDQDATNKTDLYALGLVMYQLLTGVPAQTGSNIVELFTAIRNTVPPLVTELRPELPNRLARILSQTLEKDPVNRYGSGQQIANDLVSVFGEL